MSPSFGLSWINRLEGLPWMWIAGMIVIGMGLSVVNQVTKDIL